jgi:hypothetical protein
VESDSRAVSRPNVNVTISIPVKVGGYTGQRDAWEEYEREHRVVLTDEGTIYLKSGSDVQRQISFQRADLEAALRMVGGTKPVMR